MIERLRRLVSIAHASPLLLRWASAISWAVLLWTLSARRGGGGTKTWWLTVIWNGGHVAVYFVLGSLVFFALREVVRRVEVRGVVAAMVSATYGVVDEWHQSYVPGRACSLWDMGSDVLGGTLAIACLLWLEGQVALRWLVVLIAGCAVTVLGASFSLD